MFGFYLMTEKGYKVLKGFLDNFSVSDISYVICDKDKTLHNDYYENIKKLCVRNKIPFYNRKEKFELTAKYNFAVSWRYIISQEKNLIVFHDSLLPKYRGFAPLINCLINGEKKAGVTALYASKEYDKGNIIFQESLKLQYPIKIKEAIEKIIPLYVSLVNKIALHLKQQKPLPRQTQNEKLASYSLWRDEDDFLIDWRQSAAAIERHIDALGPPYKGASTYYNGKLFRIFNVRKIKNIKIENRDPGKIIFLNKGYPVVVCGEDLIEITDIKNESGKTAIPFEKLKFRFGK